MKEINSIPDQYMNSYRRIERKEVDTKFKDAVANVSNENIVKNLVEKYCLDVSVKSVPKECTGYVAEGLTTGCAEAYCIALPVVVDPALLERIKTDVKFKNYFENKIKEYKTSYPMNKAFLSVNGIVLDGTVLIFHKDGTCEEWCFSHVSPEKEEEVRKLNEENRRERLKKKLYYKNISQDIINKNLEIQTMRNLVYNPFAENYAAMSNLLALLKLNSL